MNRTWCSSLAATLALAVGGCSGETLGFSHQTLSAPTPLHSMSECPTLDPSVTAVGLDGSVVITKACVEDDQGSYYAIPFSDSSSALLVVPSGHKYSVVYEFGSGWVPDAAVVARAAHAYLTTTGACAASGGAAGGNAQAVACVAMPQVPVASTATLQGNLLKHSLSGAPPQGAWVFSDLDFAVLYASYIASHSETWLGGFTANFETGTAPTR